jgi:hypothetical protein
MARFESVSWGVLTNPKEHQSGDKPFFNIIKGLAYQDGEAAII